MSNYCTYTKNMLGLESVCPITHQQICEMYPTYLTYKLQYTIFICFIRNIGQLYYVRNIPHTLFVIFLIRCGFKMPNIDLLIFTKHYLK